jgi:ubiquinone biosynthesis protein
MRIISSTLRLLFIQITFLRWGLDEWIYQLPGLHFLRFLRYINPWYWRNRHQPRGERLRLALISLGPIFVKFGQSLSTRRDFIPEDIADKLATLQDRVPPFPTDQACRIVEASLGKSIKDLFSCFQLQPLASASIAQVHSARLPNQNEVIVKIIRPNIEKQIIRDIDLLYLIATWMECLSKQAARLKPKAVVAEFKRSLLDELDLMREAASAEQLRRNFLHSDLLYIPKVYWPYTRNNVLVMERIYGIPISDVPNLKKRGIDLKKLAQRGVEIFFTQVFRDCFFHADMHPGNIFVSPTPIDPPKYLGVDFGIMGTLTPKDQRYLAENLLAFFKRDYRSVAQLHIESGWVPPQTRVDEFEAAIRTVCEPVFAKPLKEISFGQLILKLFQTASRFNMEIQPQLVLLQKTLFNIEGLGRQLYPDLDLWSTAHPFLEKWLRQQLGVRALLRKCIAYAPYWAEKLPEVPELIYQTLTNLRAQQTNPTNPAPRKNKSLLLRFGLICILISAFSILQNRWFLGLKINVILGILGGIGLLLWAFNLGKMKCNT